MEAGKEEAQQSTPLRSRHQAAAVWTAPQQNMPRRLLTSQTSRSKSPFYLKCQTFCLITSQPARKVSIMQELNPSQAE